MGRNEPLGPLARQQPPDVTDLGVKPAAPPPAAPSCHENRRRVLVDMDDEDEVQIDIQPPRKCDKPKAQTVASPRNSSGDCAPLGSSLLNSLRQWK